MILFTMLMSLGRAHATELYYQPRAGVEAASIQGGYRSVRSASDDPTDEDHVGTLSGLYRLGVDYAYGWSDFVSLGLNVTYSNLYGRSNGDGWWSGFEPAVASLRVHRPVGDFEWLYGLDVKFSLVGARVTAEGYPNRAFGDPVDGVNNSFTLTANLGFRTAVGPHHFGLLGAYDVLKNDSDVTVVGDGVEVTIRLRRGARSNLLGFYEFDFAKGLAGFAVDWVKQWEITLRGPVDSTRIAGYGFLHLRAYSRYEIAPDTFALPTVDYYTRALSNGGDSIEDWRWMLALRRQF